MWKPNCAVNSKPGRTRIVCKRRRYSCQPLSLLGLQPAQELEQFQIFDFSPEVSVPAHGVVIGEGDDVQTAFFGPVENVQNA